MDPNQLLTIPELMEITDLKETTLRRYLKDFKGFFHCRTYGKIKKYPMQSAEILKKIAFFYGKGHTTEEVKDILNQDTPQIIEVEPGAASLVIPDGYREVFEALAAEQKKQITELKTEMAAEMERQLAAQQNAIMENIKGENMILMAKLESLRHQPEEKKEGIWKRIFKK